MKFIIINSFRMMVYIAFFAIIIFGICYGIAQEGAVSARLMFVPDDMRVIGDIVLCGLAGFLSATLICGLIATVLDIRDDLNDRLPHERQT